MAQTLFCLGNYLQTAAESHGTCILRNPHQLVLKNMSTCRLALAVVVRFPFQLFSRLFERCCTVHGLHVLADEA